MPLNRYLIILALCYISPAFSQADFCSGATDLPVGLDCSPKSGGTQAFTSTSQDNSCGGNTDDDAWFKFTAISPFTRVTIFTDQVNDMAVAIFKSDCKTEIACVDNRGLGGQEFINIETIEGKEYYVQLYEVNEGWGPYLICITTLNELPTDTPEFCPLTLEFSLTLNPANCVDSTSGSMEIRAIDGGVAPYLFLLDTNDFQSSPSFTNLNARRYALSIMDADSCRKDTFFDLTNIGLDNLDFSIGPDLNLNQGTNFNLPLVTNIEDTQIKNIDWRGIDIDNCHTTCLRPTFIADISTTIEAILTTVGNCQIMASTDLLVHPQLDIYIPTVFSPNGDGINDNFTVFSGAGIKNVRAMSIYDRWGNLIFKRQAFSPNQPSLGWDGTFNQKKRSPDTFFYLVEVELPDNTTQLFSGTITLLGE